MFFIIVKIPVILYMVINFTKSPIDVFAVTMNGNGEYAFTIVNDHLEAVCATISSPVYRPIRNIRQLKLKLLNH